MKIYVRKLNASEEEDNSLLNNELIQKGVDSVDCYGNLVLDPTLEDKRDTQQVKANANSREGARDVEGHQYSIPF